MLWQCLVADALFCLTLVFFASALYNVNPFAVYSAMLQGWDGLAGSWAQVSELIYSVGIDGRLPVVLLSGCFIVFAAEHNGRSVARWIRQQVWPLRWTLYYGAAAAILFFAAFRTVGVHLSAILRKAVQNNGQIPYPDSHAAGQGAPRRTGHPRPAQKRRRKKRNPILWFLRGWCAVFISASRRRSSFCFWYRCWSLW